MGVGSLRARRSSALAVALIIGAAAMVSGAPVGVRAAGAATCAAATPEIGEVMTSQGIPSYGKLIRGKKTVIKLFLTVPTTCTASGSIYVSSASVTLQRVSPDGTVVDTTTIPTLSVPVTVGT